MSALVGATYRQIRWERKIFWRNPASAGFTFAFPLMFLVIFAAINGNSTVRLAHGTAKFAQYYVPAIVAFGVISACYSNLAFSISIRRERGVLKRVRGTPLSPTAYLAGIVGNAVIVSAILTVLTITLGLTAHGISVAAPLPGSDRDGRARRRLLHRVRSRGRDVHPQRGFRARDRELRPLPAPVHLRDVRHDLEYVVRRPDRGGVSGAASRQAAGRGVRPVDFGRYLRVTSSFVGVVVAHCARRHAVPVGARAAVAEAVT